MSFVPQGPAGVLWLVVLAAAPAQGTDAAPERLWPLAARPAVSSNFCEYRAGHLHAGIDIRSFGHEGIPCIASGDGYVSRIRAASSGYGKSLYLQLDSGETLVYAHLAEFSPVLEDTLYEEQLAHNRYRVDFRPRRGRFRVARGDTIAYSGRTGTSAPHLHFEVRNEQEHPLDPFAHGFALEDNLRPIFQNVLFVPLDVDGGPPFELEAQKIADGRFTLCDTLSLKGTMGMSVQIVDFLNKDSGRLAPHRIELIVNGITITDIALDQFSFPQGSEVDFVYDVGRVRNRKEYFFQLFERTGETLWNRHFTRRGRLTPVPGVSSEAVHEAVVIARDRAGNAAELQFMFRNEGEVQTARCGEAIRPCSTELYAGMGPLERQRLTAYAREGFPIYWYFFEHFVRRNMSETAVAWNEIRSNPGHRRPPARDELSATPWPLCIQVAGVKAGIERDVVFPGLLSLHMSKRTLYGGGVFYALPWKGKLLDGNGQLRLLNKPVQIGPYSLTLRADMTIRLHADQPDTKASIYRLNESKGEWVFYESTIEGDTVSTTAKRPGVYAVFSDRRAPRVGKMHVSEHKSYATGVVTPQIIIPILDEGSGVESRRLVVTIGTRKTIARWEGDTEKLFVVVRDRNIIGSQVVTVEAFDRAGNRTFVEREIIIH